MAFLRQGARRDPITLLKSAGRVRKIIRANNPDIVHTHGPRAHFFVDMAQLFQNGPAVVSSVHGSFSQFVSGNEGEFGNATRALKKILRALVALPNSPSLPETNWEKEPCTLETTAGPF